MEDRKIRLTIDVCVDNEACEEHGISPESVLRSIRLEDSNDTIDGYTIVRTQYGETDDTSGLFFLCDGKLMSKKFISPAAEKEELVRGVVGAVSGMLNSFDRSRLTQFCNEMSMEHRTLQQTFTSLCLRWLRLCASEEYRVDGRNEASQRLARILLEGHDLPNDLPLI